MSQKISCHILLNKKSMFNSIEEKQDIFVNNSDYSWIDKRILIGILVIWSIIVDFQA